MLHEYRKHGDICMTRIILILVLALPLVLAGESVAFRPVAESPSFVESLAQEVSSQRREHRRSSRESKNGHPDRRVLDAAMEQYLVLIETLCNRARRIEGPTGSRLLLAAVTLREGLPHIRNLFEDFAKGECPEPKASQIRSRLVGFTRTVRAGLSRIPNSSVEHPEKMLVSMLEPLKEACQEMAGIEVAQGWWADGRKASIESSTATNVSKSLEGLVLENELVSELESLPLDDQLRSSAIELIDLIHAHSWFHGGARKRILSVLEIELRSTRLDELSRMDLVRRIDAMGELVDAFGKLSTSSGGRSIATRNSASVLDLMEFRLEQLPPADTTAALTGAVETLALIRDQESKGLDGEEARIHARISKQCRLAEQRLFDSFGEIVSSESPWTDPAIVVVLVEPLNLLEALSWLHDLKTWKNRLDDLDRTGSGRLIKGLRSLISAMVDQATREDARRALREFQRQFALFSMVDEADDRLGGRGRDRSRHADRIAEAWGTWIGDWSGGRSAGEGGVVLYNYCRLIDHLRLIESTDREALHRVDAWSGWELPVDHIMDRRERFGEVVEMYAKSMASGNWSEANELANRLEHPFSGLRLIGSVADRAPDTQAVHPALVIIGQLVVAPVHDGLLVNERSRLAAITQSLLEIEFLISNDRLEEAESLQEWVGRETRRLNRRLGLVPARPLAVPGMRDDTTRIGVDGMQMMQ